MIKIDYIINVAEKSLKMMNLTNSVIMEWNYENTHFYSFKIEEESKKFKQWQFAMWIEKHENYLQFIIMGKKYDDNYNTSFTPENAHITQQIVIDNDDTEITAQLKLCKAINKFCDSIYMIKNSSIYENWIFNNTGAHQYNILSYTLKNLFKCDKKK